MGAPNTLHRTDADADRLRHHGASAKAQGVKMAQDVQIGRDRDDRYDRDRDYRYDRDRRRYDSDATVGVGPGGVTIGPRQRCHMETTTIERDDGRIITRRERRCD